MKQTFKKFLSKLVFEGLLKSFIASAVIAFGACVATAVLTWMLAPELWWTVFVVFGGVMVISVPLFFFLRYRPSMESVAARVDRLGFNERAITMLELENENTFFANIQRADAIAKIESIKPSGLRLSVSMPAVIAMASVFIASAAFTVVGALSNDGIVPSGKELIYAEEETYYTVEYIVEEGGMIIGGEEVQAVLAGEDTVTVEAIPDEGWAFIGWFDAETMKNVEDLMMFGKLEDAALSTDFYRTEINVQSDISIYALFTEMGEGEEGEGDGEGGGEGEPSDQPADAPSNGEGEGDGDGGGDSPLLPEQGGGAGGGKDKEGNNINDGKTPYGDLIDEYLDQAMEYVQNGQDVPEDIKKLIEEYYNIIK